MQYCGHPRCSRIVRRGYCEEHQQAREQLRPNVLLRRWYRTRRWRELAALVRREEPLCRDEVNGETCGRPTEDVDHVIPHNGDVVLFWSRRNLRARCHSCHSRKTAHEPRAGRL